MFAFQRQKVFSVGFDDISSILKLQYFTPKKGTFCLLRNVVFAVLGKLIFAPAVLLKNLSSLQHNLFYSNYQYKNIFRLAIRLQLNFILFLPVAVASQKNEVGAWQKGQ